jgi:hypothetical protein
MDLKWDGWREYMYVRGHMPPEEAHKALEAFYGARGTSYYWDSVEPRYARWCCHGSYEEDHILDDNYTSPGRGRFPVMRAVGVRPVPREVLVKLREDQATASWAACRRDQDFVEELVREP